MKEVARNLEPAKIIPYPANIQKWAIIVGISKYKDESLNSNMQIEMLRNFKSCC
jgi:hypothetical protein